VSVKVQKCIGLSKFKVQNCIGKKIYSEKMRVPEYFIIKWSSSIFLPQDGDFGDKNLG
jgi:hypothetical protein